MYAGNHEHMMGAPSPILSSINNWDIFDQIIVLLFVWDFLQLQSYLSLLIIKGNIKPNIMRKQQNIQKKFVL